MNFNYFFAGVATKESTEYIINNNLNKLLSYLEKSMITFFIEAKKNGYNGLICVDSGAFSAWTKGKKIDVTKYLEFLNENHKYLDVFINLDEIPGRKGHLVTKEQIEKAINTSNNNMEYLMENLIDSSKFMAVYHAGEPMEQLEKILNYKNSKGQEVQYLGIGGVVGKQRDSHVQKMYEMIFKMIESKGKLNKLKVHVLGCADKRIISKFPFWSSDSATFCRSAVTGGISTDMGSIGNCAAFGDKNLIPEIKNAITELTIPYGYTFNDLYELPEVESRNNRIIYNLKYLEKTFKNFNSGIFYKETKE